MREVTDRNIYIVYNGVRYRLVEGRDCTNHCSFRKADGPYYCERGCYLPRWFKRLCISVDCWLERIDENDAELRAENARLRAALKPVLDIVMDSATSDLSMELAINEAKRIYNEAKRRERKGAE